MRKITLLKISAAALAVPVALAISVGSAEAGCKSGYVWRDAKGGDGVCVTPAERTEAKAQNANARNNRRPGGGPYTDQTPAETDMCGGKRSPGMSFV